MKSRFDKFMRIFSIIAAIYLLFRLGYAAAIYSAELVDVNNNGYSITYNFNGETHYYE